jgi:hypothetical protein
MHVVSFVRLLPPQVSVRVIGLPLANLAVLLVPSFIVPRLVRMVALQVSCVLMVLEIPRECKDCTSCRDHISRKGANLNGGIAENNA